MDSPSSRHLNPDRTLERCDDARRDTREHAAGRDVVAGRRAECARSAVAADSPWAGYAEVFSDGLCVRVASSRRDAEGMRDVLHSAWRVGEDEGYFYETFNDPDALYREFIEPSLSCDDLRSLDVLCMVAEQADGRIISTFSLVFDHNRCTIELGRGAVARDHQCSAVPQRFVAVVKRVFERLPGYSVVADATTLVRSATRYAYAFGSLPVALHPSSFVIQAGCVDTWLSKLERKHGAAAEALLWRSETSGLGRFTTVWHVSPIAADGPAFRPHLSAAQQPLFDYSRETLNAGAGEIDQPAIARTESIADNAGTRTRTIVNPAAERTPASMLADAAQGGFETVVVQVPCDRENEFLHRRLEASEAVLSGVFPDAAGYWYASYTLLVGADHRDHILANLRHVREVGALDASYHRLLDIVLASLAWRGRDADASASTPVAGSAA